MLKYVLALTHLTTLILLMNLTQNYYKNVLTYEMPAIESGLDPKISQKGNASMS